MTRRNRMRCPQCGRDIAYTIFENEKGTVRRIVRHKVSKNGLSWCVRSVLTVKER